MIKFCAITPDRGDRPRFFQHMLYQMQRQTVKPEEHIIVGPSVILPGKESDLTARVRKGIQMAREKGYEYAFIIENDDYYPDDYFERMIPWLEDDDLVGYSNVVYYHLFRSRYSILRNTDHAPLMSTAFRLEIFDDFKWPPDYTVSLDITIWRNADCGKFLLTDFSHGPIGIKHGIGRCAGAGHNDNFPYVFADGNFRYMRDRMRPESIAFYTNLIVNH